MDFFCSCVPQEANDVAGCGSPDDGIIQKDKTLSLDHGTVGGKLHLDARIPELLSGFNKSAAHIPVFDKPHLIGKSAFFTVSHGGRKRRIRNAHHHIRI